MEPTHYSPEALTTGTPPPGRSGAPTAGLGLPTRSGGDLLLAAETHHRLKCPKCDHVQSASNKVCANCGHNLTQARKGKFAKLGMSNPASQSDLLLSDDRGLPASFHAQLSLAEDRKDGLVWKALCKTGELALSPGPGQIDNEEPLVLSDELFKHLHTSVQEQAFPYVTVPTTHANGLLENSGYVKKTEIVPSTDPNDPPGTMLLMGGIQFTEPDVHTRVLNGSIPDCSIGVKFNYRNKRTGKLYPAALEHVALTHQPWVDGLPAFGALSQDQKTFEPVPEDDATAFAGVYMSAETASALDSDGDILPENTGIDGIPSQFFSHPEQRRKMPKTTRKSRRPAAPGNGTTVEQLLASQQVQIEESNARAQAAEDRAAAAEAAAGSSAQAIHLSAVQAKCERLQSAGYVPSLVKVVRDLELAAGPSLPEVDEEHATLSLAVTTTPEGGEPTTEVKHLSVSGIVDLMLGAIPTFKPGTPVTDLQVQLDQFQEQREPSAQEKTAKEKSDAIYDEMKRRGPGAGTVV